MISDDLRAFYEKIRDDLTKEADALKENIATGNVPITNETPWLYWVAQHNTYRFVLGEMTRLIRRIEGDKFEEDKDD